MRLTTIKNGQYVLKVTEMDMLVTVEHFYTSDYIAELLTKITKLRAEHGDDIDMELVDGNTGEVLFYQEIIEKDVLYKQGGPLVDLANLL